MNRRTFQRPHFGNEIPDRGADTDSYPYQGTRWHVFVFLTMRSDGQTYETSQKQ